VRAVVARVARAAVRVGDEAVGEIGPGLLVLLGVHRDDDAAAAPVMARKLHELRILDGERSCAETGAPLLVVSQFTLYGDTRKGRRPSWSAAAPPEQAALLIAAVVDALRGRGARVATGVFGAAMAVESVNDGPFTVLVEVPRPPPP
jgi:D-tyrosyl-tRNA(Tyr) deacylase